MLLNATVADVIAAAATVSGNMATQNGGGINNSGTASLSNSTVTNNSGGTISGGGVYLGLGGSGTVTNSANALITGVMFDSSIPAAVASGMP